MKRNLSDFKVPAERGPPVSRSAPGACMVSTARWTAIAMDRKVVTRSADVATVPREGLAPVANSVRIWSFYHSDPIGQFGHSFLFWPILSLPSPLPTECPPGQFGWQCAQSCHCQNGASCDPATGQCLCPPGFQGDHVGTGYIPLSFLCPIHSSTPSPFTLLFTFYPPSLLPHIFPNFPFCFCPFPLTV